MFLLIIHVSKIPRFQIQFISGTFNRFVSFRIGLIRNRKFEMFFAEFVQKWPICAIEYLMDVKRWLKKAVTIRYNFELYCTVALRKMSFN